MNDHRAALDLAAATHAFPLSAGEAAELEAHLRSCPACSRIAARLRADAAAIADFDPGPLPGHLRDRIREAVVTTHRSGPSALGLALILGLLSIAAIGASLGAGGFLGGPRQAAPSEPSTVLDAAAIHWRTGVVELAADHVRIGAGGRVFSGNPAATRVDGDDGNLEAWTLETAWTELGQEQRLFLYFASDGREWWIREVRTYDDGGNAKAWVTYPAGPYARTPLGMPWQGDLSLTGRDTAGHPVTLELDGVQIAVRPQDPITRPVGGGIVLRELPNDAGNPFGPTGSLRCSGILQLAPKVAETRLLWLGYRLSWRWVYSTGGNTGYAAVMATAPDTGWISDAAVGSSGELIVFVEDPANPMRKGPPPMLPADCPAPSP